MRRRQLRAKTINPMGKCSRRQWGNVVDAGHARGRPTHTRPRQRSRGAERGVRAETSRGRAVRAEIERVLIVAVLRRVVAWERASESPGARWRRWALARRDSRGARRLRAEAMGEDARSAGWHHVHFFPSARRIGSVRGAAPVTRTTGSARPSSYAATHASMMSSLLPSMPVKSRCCLSSSSR